MQASSKVRLTADLPASVVAALKELAESQGVTMTEALRRSITTEKLLQNRVDDGERILVEKKDGRIAELLLFR